MDSFTSKRHLFFYTKLPVNVKNCHSFWINYPHVVAIFLQEELQRSTKMPTAQRRNPHVSQWRAGTSLLTFLHYRFGAPCVTATIKITETVKISLPIGVWASEFSFTIQTTHNSSAICLGTQSWRQRWTPDYRMLSIGQSGSAGSWWNNLHLPALLSPLWSCSVVIISIYRWRTLHYKWSITFPKACRECKGLDFTKLSRELAKLLWKNFTQSDLL